MDGARLSFPHPLVLARTFRLGLLAAGITGLIALPLSLQAVEVETPGSTPPAGLPLENLGRHVNSSVIFLGEIGTKGTYWAITADHTRSSGTASHIVLNGTNYSILGSHLLMNDPAWNFARDNSDILLLQIDITATAAENFAIIPIATALPSPDATGYLLGRGGNSSWGTTNATYSTPEGSSAPVIFPLDLTRANSSTIISTTVAYGTVTDMDDPDVPITAGWGVTYDSGGGLLYFDGDQWIISGLMLAASDRTENPHMTYVADLSYSYYLNQIDSIINAPIPEPGTYALLGLGALSALGLRLRHRKKQGRP